MPYSIVEAFAAGTPVIGTHIGGIPELVSDGETGFLCEPGDVHAMSEAILRGVETFMDAARYATMQQNCREYVVKNCSCTTFMNRLVDLYKEAVNG